MLQPSRRMKIIEAALANIVVSIAQDNDEVDSCELITICGGLFTIVLAKSGNPKADEQVLAWIRDNIAKARSEMQKELA